MAHWVKFLPWAYETLSPDPQHLQNGKTTLNNCLAIFFVVLWKQVMLVMGIWKKNLYMCTLWFQFAWMFQASLYIYIYQRLQTTQRFLHLLFPLMEMYWSEVIWKIDFASYKEDNSSSSFFYTVLYASESDPTTSIVISDIYILFNGPNVFRLWTTED